MYSETLFGVISMHQGLLALPGQNMFCTFILKLCIPLCWTIQ